MLVTSFGMYSIGLLILNVNLPMLKPIFSVVILILPPLFFIAARRFDRDYIYRELKINMRKINIFIWVGLTILYAISFLINLGFILYYFYPLLGIIIYSIVDYEFNLLDFQTEV